MDFNLNNGKITVRVLWFPSGQTEVFVDYTPFGGNTIHLDRFFTFPEAIVAYSRISKFLWKKFREEFDFHKWIRMLIEASGAEDRPPRDWPPEV